MPVLLITMLITSFLTISPASIFAQDDGIDLDVAIRLGAGIPIDGSLSTYEGIGPWFGADIIVWITDRYGIAISGDYGFMSADEKDSHWLNAETRYTSYDRYRGLDTSSLSLNGLWRSNNDGTRKYYYFGGGLTYVKGVMNSFRA